jgi:23S rRNA pseudouridine1911/1915/1917 synthase
VTEVHLAFRFEAAQPQRLDKYLVQCMPDFSRSRLQSLIKNGKVTVNGLPAHKAGQMIEAISEVLIGLPEPVSTGLVPESIALDIVFENEDLMVVNKPAGMVVHPAAGHFSGTLVHAALAHAPQMAGIGGEQRPGVVHRLDKDTSGLILLAKNDAAHRWLVNQFKDRKVEKIYLALVDGHPPSRTGRVEAPIGRSPAHRQMMAVVPLSHGRQAVTEYRTLEIFPEHTLIEAHPITGRTHQIRVHMEFLGCPVAADTIYGRRQSSLRLNRFFLHAARLTIRLPDEKEARIFEAPLPSELLKVLEQLRQSQPPDAESESN